MSNRIKADPLKGPIEFYSFSTDGIDYKVPIGFLAEDVQMLAILFLVKGNNLFKILKTISKEAKVAVSAKTSVYKIKSDDESEALAPKRKEKVVLSSKDTTFTPHYTGSSKVIRYPWESRLDCY